MLTRDALVLMTIGVLMLAALSFGGDAAERARVAAAAPLDAPVRTIRLGGADSVLRVRTAEDGNRELRLRFDQNLLCNVQARLERNGAALDITIRRGWVWLHWWCDPAIEVTLPPGLNMSVAVGRLTADLAGQFDRIDIQSGASVIDFRGSAEHFRLRGSAAIARLGFSSDTPHDVAELEVGALLSQVTFDD